MVSERYKTKLRGDVQSNFSLNLSINVPDVWLNARPTIIDVFGPKEGVSGALRGAESLTSQSRQDKNVFATCHVTQEAQKSWRK